jgi:RNA polymerase sigma factor (sigma-70 family)
MRALFRGFQHGLSDASWGQETEISVERITHVSPDTTQAAMYESCDDLALVHATKDGDVGAFEELVKRYDRRLLRIAQNLTHNREDSEDAVQEAFLKAFQHLEQFRESAKFSTWLIRIALNESLLKLRKQRVASELFVDNKFEAEEDVFPIDVADWAPNPEELLPGVGAARDPPKNLARAESSLERGLRVAGY